MRYIPYGAVGQVTGSRHLIECGNSSILLDCGLFQGEHERGAKLNHALPFDASKINAVMLSHGHIDHSGSLPTLVKSGFRGHIYATSATRDVTELMLYDTAKIQRQDIEYKKRHNIPLTPETEPIYEDKDVADTMERFVALEYDQCLPIQSGVEGCFYNSGHILGSAAIHLELTEKNQAVRLAYSGDLGKKIMPILRGPEILPESDVLICESTYGDRQHEDLVEAEGLLQQIIKEVVAKKAKIFVPAFALGRMQTLIYALHRLFDQKKIPTIPIYIDSPLAVDLTAVFAKHPECFDEETRRDFLARHEQPFRFPTLRYISSAEESKALNHQPGPMMILATSGMVEAGRILHHLQNGIADPNNVILLVGYMARNTLGRAILEGAKSVRVFRSTLPVRAKVIKINAYSAHADRDELAEYIAATPGLKELFLVHGDADTRQKFAQYLRAKSAVLKIRLPEYGEEFNLTSE